MSVKNSYKIKPPTDVPKTRSKKLTVKVIDIKNEIPSDFKVDQIIAEIESDKIEKEPIIFGRGPQAQVKFSEKNIFVAEK